MLHMYLHSSLSKTSSFYNPPVPFAVFPQDYHLFAVFPPHNHSLKAATYVYKHTRHSVLALQSSIWFFHSNDKSSIVPWLRVKWLLGFVSTPSLIPYSVFMSTCIINTPSLSPQKFYQALNFGMIVSSALMIWKGLMVVTGSESPIVVVLR